jgi:hypothetical protein
MLFRLPSVAPAFLRSELRFKRCATGEFVQNALADTGLEITGSEFFTLFAQFRNPRFVLRAKLLLELLANALG